MIEMHDSQIRGHSKKPWLLSRLDSNPWFGDDASNLSHVQCGLLQESNEISGSALNTIKCYANK